MLTKQITINAGQGMTRKTENSIKRDPLNAIFDRTTIAGKNLSAVASEIFRPIDVSCYNGNATRLIRAVTMLGYEAIHPGQVNEEEKQILIQNTKEIVRAVNPRLPQQLHDGQVMGLLRHAAQQVINIENKTAQNGPGHDL